MIRERDIFFILLTLLFLAGIAGAILNSNEHGRELQKNLIIENTRER